MFQKTQMTLQEIESAVGYLSIHDTLRMRASIHPDKKLFTFLDDDGFECDYLSYLDLWQRARSIADILEKESDKGDRIILFFPQGLDFIAAFFGCLLSNRIAVPLNLPNKRRVDKCVGIIKDTDAKIAIAPKKTKEKIANSFINTDAANLLWINSEDVSSTGGDKPFFGQFRSDTDINSVAFLQYTSGSTSAPKGVMVTHRNISLNLQMMRDSWCLNTESNMVFWQPHHHDMGLIMGQLLPVLLGNHTVVMSPNTAVRQPAIWLRAISDYRAVLSGGPNFIYDLAVTRYSEKRLEGVDFSNWQIAPNGADVVRATTLNRFYETFKGYGFKLETFMPCYGLAEGTLFVTGGPTRQLPLSTEVEKKALETDRKVIRAKDSQKSHILVGCGEPNWETELAIVNPDTFVKCNRAEVGEIWINSLANAQGYWKNPKATEQTFYAKIHNNVDKQYLRTGDIGFIGDDSQLYICGRLKDLIICEGRNLHPEDIEYTILEASERIKPQSCAVFSYDKDDQKQAMVAVIETDRELKRSLDIDAKELRLQIGRSVTDIHGIGLNQIVFIPPATLKKTTSGKVQRSLMKDLYLKGQLDILQA